MLTKIGDVSEEEIVEAARWYAAMYNGKVPFNDEGVVRYVVFDYILERWCFMCIVDA
jgi:hypothetical protein